MKIRQKTNIKAFAILCLIVFLTMGFYSYQKYQEYSLFKTAVEKNKEFITALRDSVSNEKALFDSGKEDFDGLNEEIEEKLSYIFPATDDYTALTRQLDSFEDELTSKNSPFDVSSISYQTVTEEGNYSVLPFRMSIRSSAENFTKFLHLIENSGSLNDRIRLMDLSSIRLNFEGGNDNDGPEIISFTVQINSFFQ